MEVEAIKDLKKIQAMKILLRSRSLRDEAMFVLGINTALLRMQDLFRQGKNIVTVQGL
jgi:hypothetical protein